MKQRGEEVTVGVPLNNKAGPVLGGAAGVEMVGGLISTVAKGADDGLVRPPLLSHPGGDGIVYQLKSMVA